MSNEYLIVDYRCHSIFHTVGVLLFLLALLAFGQMHVCKLKRLTIN